MPNGTYGGVRGEKFIKNYPLLDFYVAKIIKKEYNLKSIQELANMKKTNWTERNKV